MQERFRYMDATATVTAFERKFWILHNVYSTSRGKGEATKLMEMICEWADTRGIKLRILVNAYGPHPTLTNDQLERWYSKFGFVRDDNGYRPYTMTRIAIKTWG